MQYGITTKSFSDEEIGGISLEDVFEAYFECRKKKRNTCNALAFESEYERKCVELWREINSGTYHPSRSIAFIINKPVKREVFAADFRDRVVHHLIAQRIVPLLEEQFINDSYSTRKGKGTLYGILKIEEHIRQCSENYTKDCHILKIDIRSFFMKISKQRLYDITAEFLKARYTESDLPMLLYLLRKTVFNRPERNCIRRSAPKEWRGLPKDKSLFHTDGSFGLPIGNLTSQLLALNYLDELDHLITENGEWSITGGMWTTWCWYIPHGNTCLKSKAVYPNGFRDADWYCTPARCICSITPKVCCLSAE